MFYDELDRLCAEKGMSVTELMREIGVAPSSASRWKNKGYEPSRAVAKKIADYFGISVTELMSGEKEKPATVSNDELSADEIKLLNNLRQLPPDKRAIVEQLALSLRDSQG